ncbi:NYN domain-containing protein [Acidovorax sp. SUPP3334]|uniref:NYN domain-containing protein n=1 Tax=Acidovorax sp. SUPP3334 TaxID=2920881 RepID=UPI0023DE5F31|nr:NYN domain-containing protein [Acidovorax sp. SUPP3334]GKT25391.1 NYN domain-containing protein [Acidovorax sp. SUPP3334]
MTAFFIDADNLCAPAWVEEAFRTLEQHEGSVSLRRAYGSADKLKGLGEVLRTRMIRPYMNLSLTKNTTDVALAVDVMELSYAPSCPSTIAIGSGDADFVPLVLRLRERGFRVVCLSDRGKMAPEAVNAYDQVFLVGQETEPVTEAPTAMAVAAPPAPQAPAAKKTPARKTTPRKAAAPKAAEQAAPAKKAPAKKAAAKKATSATATKATGGTAAGRNAAGSSAGKSVSVRQILDHAPALKAGQWQPLGAIVKLLHDAKLLGKNTASTKLFKKFPDQFELSPQTQPNAVRYLSEGR